MINLMKLIEILEEHNLVPCNLVHSNYRLEREEGKWFIKYETERGIFTAYVTELGCLKLVIPLMLYDSSPELLIGILNINGRLEGSLTIDMLFQDVDKGSMTIINYERDIPPHRLTEASQDICQIFKIIKKELCIIDEFLYGKHKEVGLSLLERLENTFDKEVSDEG